MALSGHSATICFLCFRAEADIRDRVASTTLVANNPSRTLAGYFSAMHGPDLLARRTDRVSALFGGPGKGLPSDCCTCPTWGCLLHACRCISVGWQSGAFRRGMGSTNPRVEYGFRDHPLASLVFYLVMTRRCRGALRDLHPAHVRRKRTSSADRHHFT